jgi:hypothetical protein
MLAARHPQRCYTNDCAPIIRGILHADGLALSPIQQWSTPEDDRQALTGIMNLVNVGKTSLLLYPDD